MNAPVVKGLAIQAPAYVKNQKLIAWVANWPINLFWMSRCIHHERRQCHVPLPLRNPRSLPYPATRLVPLEKRRIMTCRDLVDWYSHPHLKPLVANMAAPPLP